MANQAEQDDTDAALFRQAMSEVTPLPPTDRRSPPRVPPLIPRMNEHSPTMVADRLSNAGASEEEATEFTRNGLNKITLRKLRRGVWPPQDSLDLHGLNADQARRLLQTFLHEAGAKGLRCVNIIHGKGWRSEGREGLLKMLTRHWLTQYPAVLAFCEAPPQAGGGGAVWVLLSQK